jgi:hypothetical protein
MSANWYSDSNNHLVAEMSHPASYLEYFSHFFLIQEKIIIRSYLKNADTVQEQEAHLNQYNQMCYPAYAGAQADEKAEHTREYVSILRRSATQ